MIPIFCSSQHLLYDTPSLEETQFHINFKNPKTNYAPGNRYTLIFEIINQSEQDQELQLTIRLPKTWKVLTKGLLKTIKKGSGTISLLNIYIPPNAVPGQTGIQIFLKNKALRIIGEREQFLSIGENNEIELSVISKPDEINAGEVIETYFKISNKGNVNQDLLIESNGRLMGDERLILKPDSSSVIRVSKKSDPKIYSFKKISTQIRVLDGNTDTTYYKSSQTLVYPHKIPKKKPKHIFPVKVGLNYNSYNKGDYYYSVLTADLNGNGFLDVNRDHFLSFRLRYPPKNQIQRFGVSDQYSIQYSYKDSTHIYLGDHGHNLDILGFGARFGLGMRIHQYWNKWNATVFYSKPRVFRFNSAPLIGGKVVFEPDPTIKLGLSLGHSRGSGSGANRLIEGNLNEVGQIGTFSFSLDGLKTHLNTEASLSRTNFRTSTAAHMNFSQELGRFFYNGSVTLAGKDYFGILNNSIQFSNNFSYSKDRWSIMLGQALNRVNQRLDPLLFAAEPYSQNFFGNLNYQFTKGQSFRLRFDTREREDRLFPRSYHYKEHGLDYSYRFHNNALNVNFTGRIGKTRNLLAVNSSYRDTYSHMVNANYYLVNFLQLRGSIFHNCSNRYNLNNHRSNFMKFSFGGDIRFFKNLRFNINYNSSFSPEETYLKRDFFNGNLVFEPRPNHHLEVRANYFKNPGERQDAELLVSARYSLMLNLPIKRNIENRKVTGIFQSQEDVSLKGIRLKLGGKKLHTDNHGKFVVNNLVPGLIRLDVDESTLPIGLVLINKVPLEIDMKNEMQMHLNLELVKSGTVNGRVSIINKDKEETYTGYVRLKNEKFSYLVSTNNLGDFSFRNIVPGDYQVELLNLEQKEYVSPVNQVVQVEKGKTTYFAQSLLKKPPRIKFSRKSFKLSSKK